MSVALAARHPLVDGDIQRIWLHILLNSGDVDAADRREQECEDGIAEIARNPRSGTRLDGALAGCRVRHVGRGNAITILFRPDETTGGARILLVSFGGEDWAARGETRR